MKTFHFNDKIPLDFEGRAVFVPLKTAREKIDESLKTVIPECAKIIENGETKENIEKCAEKLYAFLADFIGSDAVEAIFENRAVSFADLCDVYSYICSETADFAAAKNSAQNTVSGNETDGKNEHIDA